MKKFIIASLVSIGILSYWADISFCAAGKKLGRNRYEPGAVSKISAGNNISVTPSNGNGNVTVSVTDNVTVSSFNAAQITSTNPYHGLGTHLSGTFGFYDGTTRGFARGLTVTGAGNGGFSLTGDTVTLTMLDTTGSGAGGTSTGPFRTWDVTVGTLGAANVDIASNTTEGYVAALRQCGLGRNSTTGYCRIFYNPGVYSEMYGATIPANVQVYAIPNSSTVWNMSLTTVNVATVYGDISGVTVDVSSLAFTDAIFDFKTGGSLGKNGQTRILNCQAKGLTAVAYFAPAILRINNSSNNYVNAYIDKWIGAAAQTLSGDRAPIMVYQSTNVVLKLETDNAEIIGGQDNHMVGIAKSNNVKIQDGHFKKHSGMMTVVADSKNWMFLNNIYEPNAGGTGGSTLGLIHTGGDTVTSTGAAIVGNTFVLTSDVASTCIYLGASGNAVKNVIVDGNKAVTNPSNLPSWQFITIDGFKTILQNNSASGVGTFITDTGIQTLFTNRQNTFNGIEQ